MFSLAFSYRTGIAALLLTCLPVTALYSFDQPLAADVIPGLTEEQIDAERWDAISVCFRCHDMSEQTLSLQPRRRQKKHRKAMKKQRSCLDCHNATDVFCCHDNMFPPIERWN